MKGWDSVVIGSLTFLGLSFFALLFGPLVLQAVGVDVGHTVVYEDRTLRCTNGHPGFEDAICYTKSDGHEVCRYYMGRDGGHACQSQGAA